MDHYSERDYVEEQANGTDAFREDVFELAAVDGERLRGGWRLVNLGETWAAVHIGRGVIEQYETRGQASDAAHYHSNRDARVADGGCVADAFRPATAEYYELRLGNDVRSFAEDDWADAAQLARITGAEFTVVTVDADTDAEISRRIVEAGR